MVSQSVLVMSLLPGESLLDGLEKLTKLHAEAQGVSVDVLKARLKAEAEEAAAREESAEGRADSDGRKAKMGLIPVIHIGQSCFHIGQERRSFLFPYWAGMLFIPVSIFGRKAKMGTGLARAYMQTSRVAVNAGVALYNGSFGLFGSGSKKKYRAQMPSIDLVATSKELCAVLGHQVRASW